MILYVNGDGHAPAAEAVNQYKTGGEDPNLPHLGRLPHPENLSVSWGKLLSLTLRAGLQCDATVDNTVDSIIDTTTKWVDEKGTDAFVIIQWPDTTNDEDKIWLFHQDLVNRNVNHIFFNSTTPVSEKYNWGRNYITDTYTSKIQYSKIETVAPNSDYFGKDGHSVWNRFILNYIISYKFI